MIHQTEIESKDYDKVTANTRSFIVAKSDHEYNVGDFLGLNEIIICQNGEQRETGKFTLAKVLEVYEDEKLLKEGYVILSIRKYQMSEG